MEKNQREVDTKANTSDSERDKEMSTLVSERMGSPSSLLKPLHGGHVGLEVYWSRPRNLKELESDTSEPRRVRPVLVT